MPVCLASSGFLTMKSIRRLCIFVVFGFLAQAALPTLYLADHMARAQAVAVFNRIDVAGNQRTSADTVRAIAGVQAGVPVRPAEINQAVRRLFDSGLFEDVSVRPDGGRLFIEVQERPIINRIAIEGNDILEDDVLLGLVASRERQTFSPAQAERDAQSIVNAYTAAGRLSAQVTPRIIRRSENRVDLVFEVFEGDVVEIARIGFVGNMSFSDRRLRRVLATKQANLLSFLFRSDTYVQDRIEVDKQALEDFYRTRGYIDFEVLSVASELTRERDAFLITFRLREGQQYSFGNITVSTRLPDVDPDAFAELIDVDSGEIYDSERLERLLDRMNLYANELGLAFVRTDHRVARNSETQSVDIDIRLVRGQRLFVERIDITGNSTTQDRVIRRQFRLVEGDPFNRREIQRAADRIRGLGYFRTVSVDARAGSASDQAIIDVIVEEQPTGSLTFGLSYSTDGGGAGNISLSERNFRGQGQTISGSISTSSDDRHFSFGFVEPAFFDRDLLVGASVYYRTNTSSAFSFNWEEIGFRPRVSFPVSDSARLELNYRISQDELESRGSLGNLSPFVRPDAGKSITSAVGAVYTLDRTDSVVNPSLGHRLRFSQTIAGVGGDERYSKTVGSAKIYRGIFNEDVILSGELEGGFFHSMERDSRTIDRFFLGGDSLRGFRSYGIGPRDENKNPLGGNYYAVTRLEASFPLGLPEELGIYGGVFVDAGSLWGLDTETITLPAGSSNSNCQDVNGDLVCRAKSPDFALRAATGFAVYWNTAIGPLRFNFTRPLRYVKGLDEPESFRLSIGTRF